LPKHHTDDFKVQFRPIPTVLISLTFYLNQ
jgi:hypothetical protein